MTMFIVFAVLIAVALYLGFAAHWRLSNAEAEIGHLWDSKAPKSAAPKPTAAK